MQIVIDIPEDVYTRLFDNEISLDDVCEMARALRLGIPHETVTEFADRCRECGEKYGKLLKQKTGNWIKRPYGFKCSKCLIVHSRTSIFCPSCGAKMIEPQESDHKCHNCKHYMSGEQDGSCDSYICEHYSGWEVRDKE